MGKPTEAQKAAKAQENGAGQGFPVDNFPPEELNLIHQMLVQVSFPEAVSKQLAASAQMRIERFAASD